MTLKELQIGKSAVVDTVGGDVYKRQGSRRPAPPCRAQSR